MNFNSTLITMTIVNFLLHVPICSGMLTKIHVNVNGIKWNYLWVVRKGTMGLLCPQAQIRVLDWLSYHLSRSRNILTTYVLKPKRIS